MHRDYVNDSQSSTLKTCLDFAGVLVKYAADAYIADVNGRHRQTIAAIETQAVRSVPRYIWYPGRGQSTPESIESLGHDFLKATKK